MSPLSGSSEHPFMAQPHPQALWLPWKRWESVAVNIYRIPREASTWTLWEAFSREGSICSIDIWDDRHGERGSNGRVRFKPAPEVAFWETGCYVLRLPGGRLVTLSVALDPAQGSVHLKSPSREGVLYPRECHELPCQVLSIGVPVGKSTVSILREFSMDANPHMAVDVRSKAVFAYFNAIIREPSGVLGAAPRSTQSAFRLKISFLQLARIWEINHADSQEISLVIFLDTPPTCHRQSSNVMASFNNPSSWREADLWQRQTSIAHVVGENLTTVNLRRSGQIVDLGRWNVLHFKFSTTAITEQGYGLLIEMLKDHNISVEDGEHFTFQTQPPESVWRWVDLPNITDRFRSMLEEMAHQDYIYLPFNVRYQLEVCLSNRYLSEFTMSREFVERLATMEEVAAVRLLEHVATNKKQYLDPMEIFKIRYPEGVSDSMIPSYCCFMRTARITPTTVHYNTPTIDTSNRVTRNYQEYLDRFLRIRFTDEQPRSRIYSTNFNSNDEVFARIKRALTNGITIGDRRYEFLAFGNSQFREHGAYFFAPTPNLTASHIRAWMGQFHHIRHVAKYAARLGQCFSTTRALAGCNVTVKRIPDIIRNGYCFSDGIGKISKFTTRVISAEMGISDPYGQPPSAYQFRLGGCKGMLTVSADPIVSDVHIRPSQIKFEAEHRRLEIIRWSQLSAATLNRQLILVLSALGVRGRVFHDRLNAMLQSIDYAMHSDDEATKLLRRFIDPNRVTLAMAQMVSAGFRGTSEPFVCSMLALWKSWHQKYLKEKAKILVEQGASLLGVLDETRSLDGYFERRETGRIMSENEKLAALPEIFVQVSSLEEGVPPRVIQGLCIVARNPSLHPGDVRVVRAVDCKALRHLIDVIVFPQTGDRDVTSMCSGGDLDGDDYLVIWDPELIPQQWFAKPLTYAPRKVPDLGRDVTIGDITSFYVTYMKNDSLPRIAHAHMAHADYLANGVYEPKCIRLAQLHSDAVDYNKTGIPAVMERALEPRVWPHFMNKKNRRTYHSNKILGQLYDAVKTDDFSPNLTKPFDSRILDCSLVEASRPFEQYASELKVDYDTSMRRVMAQYGIRTEFEVWSTFVLSHNSMCRDFRLHEDLGKVVSGLRVGIQARGYKFLGGQRDFGHVAPLAVAMYRITHQQVQGALATLKGEDSYDDQDELEKLPDEVETEISRLPLISFPWIFDSVLCRVAQSSGHELQTAVAEAHASDARKTQSKMYTHAEVMNIVGQEHVADAITALGAGISRPASASGTRPEPSGQHQMNDLGEAALFESDIVEKSDTVASSTEPFRDFASTNETEHSAGNGLLGSIKPENHVVESSSKDSAGPYDEDDGDLDMIEGEGDVKPSAYDHLMKFLGDECDAGAGD
ncbi:hypothetical protein POX_g08817 [Penicillium oxalicum]|uniref:hypothetical protein n=1 Tax=Penicillium oxalicum TaxID=69781 RepID=UPI0020B87734|nr:hypothetical protein POX_g08817 [Penicillium oxalicum]KAI2786432.1 hypothetical protein POX_g08817 [Penicillium oxalicum]